VPSGQWIYQLSYNAYLWGYACGSGEFTTMTGIGTRAPYNDGQTVDIVYYDPRVVFTMLYGSWFGDWDSEDCLLRSILATPTYGLAAVWSGTPHWYMQHMALGETIGFSTRLTQNNPGNGLYRNQTNAFAGDVQIALMGDPTLRMHTVTPVQNLSANPGFGSVTLNWSTPSDPIVGYHVYRSSSPSGPFSRLNGSLIAANSYTDTTSPGTSTYMVRAVRLQTSASGSYYNASQGKFVTATPLAGVKPTVTVVASDPSASRVGSDPATWQFTRTGSTSGDLTVNFSFTGTAEQYTDYRRAQGDMPTWQVIPAGSSSATLTVYPVASINWVDNKTATLTLSADAAYDIGSQNTATVIIGGNGVSGTKISRVNNGVTLSWPSGAGRGYRVLTKPNPTSSTWTDAGVDINSGGNTTSWFDPASAPQRFYRVFQSR
jgi:hypothetical protein